MSASVSFSGSTIWNNASGQTGVGSVNIARQLAGIRWDVAPLMAGGSVAKNLGSEPGGLALALDYHLDTSGISSLTSALEGLTDNYGSLVIPPGQTITNCIMVEPPQFIRGAAVQNESASIVYAVRVILRFQKLR